MAKKKGNTIDNKERRLVALEIILDEYDKEDKKPSPKEVLQKLAKKGFKISRQTYYDSITELGINDSFVQDLANKSYSKLVHDSFKSIEFAERKAREILEKTWTRSKTVTKTGGDSGDISETHTTEALAEPHLKAINEIRECAGLKIKLLGGDIIKASAKKWSIQRIKDQQTITELNAKLQEMKLKSRL